MQHRNNSDQNNRSQSRVTEYRYRNTQSLLVFAMVLVASLAAVLIVGTTWVGLDSAKDHAILAEPPELKELVS